MGPRLAQVYLVLKTLPLPQCLIVQELLLLRLSAAGQPFCSWQEMSPLHINPPELDTFRLLVLEIDMAEEKVEPCPRASPL